MPTTVHHGDLRRFATDCCRGMGLETKGAELIADSLVQADLWGHQSHGVMRLFWYGARLRTGATVGNAKPEIDGGLGSLATMDGKNGPGQVVAAAAMSHAVSLSKEYGIGAVAARNSGHFGTAMYFTNMAARAGCVGFISTNASPAMAPWGGAGKRVGANPWSWAAPAGRYPPMMLDISNTAVARGKLYLAEKRGDSIPEHWAVDADGAPTTDPASGIGGAILPMAGHKGYAISVIMDMLSGVLTGGRFGDSIIGPYAPEGSSGAGHLALAIDVESARGLAEFEADMESLIDGLKSPPGGPGPDGVFYPGEPEALSDAKLRRDGIELPEETAEELREKSRSIGIAAPF